MFYRRIAWARLVNIALGTWVWTQHHSCDHSMEVVNRIADSARESTHTGTLPSNQGAFQQVAMYYTRIARKSYLRRPSKRLPSVLTPHQIQ
ncbi:hypothetical protein PGT21_025829 [Puccinia graminis f. sp. tritici]|nr:hypothetical protein PGT21_025829 [Puccinia graminis f. sp. tritici]